MSNGLSVLKIKMLSKNQDRIRTGVSKHGKTVLETREYAVSGTGSYDQLQASGGETEHYYRGMGRNHLL